VEVVAVLVEQVKLVLHLHQTMVVTQELITQDILLMTELMALAVAVRRVVVGLAQAYK
jgi:hypothetical protein